MIYNKIYEFCSTRNKGGSLSNGVSPTPRVLFILKLLKSEGIEYKLDIFTKDNYKNTNFYNIILRGSSTKMIVAHHDIVNPHIDNANDNSASVINAIALKKLRPNINVVLLDGEEMGGIGSNRLGQQVKDNKFGQIDWILNFELTGRGGKNFFIGDYPGKLSNHIINLFNCPIMNTPYNDSVTLRKYGIDSTVINPAPTLEIEDDEIEDIDDYEDFLNNLYSNKNRKYIKRDRYLKMPDGAILDTSMLFNCHNSKDSLNTISVEDMKEFVEEIVLKIID